ncbi:MAG: phosphoribosylanthranilate isomerase [Flavobacteriaceae bacterium]
MKLKICGMREPENIEAIAALAPDYLGFIFWAPSSRYVNQSTPTLTEEIKKIGVFVDATLDYIETIIKEHQLQAVQLHGNETSAYCKQIQYLGVEVIKTFSIQNDFDFSELKAYENSCDFFLFDTKGELPGGNGYCFDWSILKAYPSKKPFFLSGGIGIENVEEIQKLLKTNLPIYAIDVNSKFESAPGIKKVNELRQFKKELYEF